MYDSVYLRTETKEPIYKYVSNVKEIKDKDNNITYQGKVKNIRFYQNSTGVSLAGSLSKYIYEHNYAVLTRNDIKLVFKMLSESIKLDLDYAHVYSLEIANNFILKKPVEEYLYLLGYLKYHKCIYAENETVNFKNGLHAVKFYNKNQEMKDKEMDTLIPNIFKNRNVLRYEFKINKKLSAFYQKDEVRVYDLYSKDFYANSIEAWREYYFKINKRRELYENLISIKTPKEFKDQMALVGMNYYGTRELGNIFNSRKAEIGNNSYYRIMSTMKDLSMINDQTGYVDIIKELDNKVDYCAKYII